MAVNSAAESLKPGTTSVTISSQKPISWMRADGVQDRAQPAAQFVIVAIVEALQIHLVEVHPGPQIFEHLGSGVAVGDESGDQPGGAGLAKNRDGPFAGDQRLVVSAHYTGGAGRARDLHDFAGRD